MRISGHSGCAGSTPPTMSCARTSLLTKSARCPTLIVRSSGCIPLAVIVIVVEGGAGVGVGDGLLTDAGDVGVAGDEPPEQAAIATAAIRKKTQRSGIITRYRGRNRREPY